MSAKHSSKKPGPAGAQPGPRCSPRPRENAPQGCLALSPSGPAPQGEYPRKAAGCWLKGTWHVLGGSGGLCRGLWQTLHGPADPPPSRPLPQQTPLGSLELECWPKAPRSPVPEEHLAFLPFRVDAGETQPLLQPQVCPRKGNNPFASFLFPPLPALRFRNMETPHTVHTIHAAPHLRGR